MPYCVRHCLLLRIPKYRTGLDKMDFSGEASGPQNAQGIGCQCAAARSELSISGVFRRAGSAPAIGKCRAHHFAEHLTHLRRSREVADGAERIARCVLISVAGFHERLDAKRPFGGNPLPKRTLERSHAPPSTLRGMTLGNAWCAGGPFDTPPAPLGRKHEIETTKDHRHREPLTHVEVRRLREARELTVGIGDKFHAEAEEPVEDQECANELARL